MGPRLFDVDPTVRRRRRSNREELEPLPAGICPDCTQPVRDTVHETAALFWMHGHGYRVRTTTVSCPCGYTRHRTTTAHHPLRTEP